MSWLHHVFSLDQLLRILKNSEIIMIWHFTCPNHGELFAHLSFKIQ